MSLLIKTFDEIKAHIGADATNELHTLEPYIDDATEQYLIPILGQSEYDDLLAAYTDDEMTSDDEALLAHCQKILANFAYLLYADDGTMSISDSGFLRLEHTEGKSAYQWMLRDFKNRRYQSGWKAVEKLIRFLYTEMGNYSTWYASDERALYNKCYVWHTGIFKKAYRIDNYGTLWNLIPGIMDFQETTVSGQITSDLHQEMLTAIMEDSLTEDHLAILPMIEKWAVWHVLAENVLHYGYEFNKDGVQTATVESTSQNSSLSKDAVRRERMDLKEFFVRKRDQARNILVNYLNANASLSKYPSYYSEFVNITAEEETDPNDDKGVAYFGI